MCDVRVRETIKDVFDKTLEFWGRVDIIAKYVLSSYSYSCFFFFPVAFYGGVC